ncbi:hypothetical protein BDV59DRAFT_43467 [Aspergillus ambiguus]|uniref:uncharacterized protein n=1 Tax=Aspergillus ambiguus TaxID=176160 RepID=UPI003CCDBC2C
MDLSRLTRPAILAQCSRCSSSLAALENEWARLSNSYSLAAGWLSVELHRIAVASVKKIIPQSSDLVVLRGQVLQDVSCKLCQQKLGVLCMFESSPSIFWKLSKISFREIVTMRTVDPTFVDVPIDRLVTPHSREPTHRRERNSIQAGALVPTSATEVDHHNMSVEQQIQHQGLNIDYISNSVSNLHDTMSELKSAFTALRIELNGPGRLFEAGNNIGNDFNMVTTVLRELKAKSEEIERLKLENEALKLRNRYVEEQGFTQQPSYLSPMEETITEVQSPGLLEGSRKRPWPDSWPTGRTEAIADSFDDVERDDDSIGDFSLAESTSIPPVKIPLKESEPSLISDMAPGDPNLRIEVQRPEPQPPQDEVEPGSGHHSQQATVSKRPRLSRSVAGRPPSSGNGTKKKGGRPRKSSGQSSKQDTSQASQVSPLNEQTGNIGNNEGKESRAPNESPSDNGNAKENRPTRARGLRTSRRASSASGRSQAPADGPHTPRQERREGVGDDPELSRPPKPRGKRKSMPIDADTQKGEDPEKRKARVAERDIMVRLAMQREEAMSTESR